MHRVVKKHWVLASASLFISLAVLGALQGYVLAKESILIAIPKVLWPICLLIGTTVLAQLFKLRLLEIISGLAILVLGSSILFGFPLQVADYWLSVPRALGGSVLLSVGATSLLSHRQIKMWAALATLTLAGFTFVVAQAWLWQLTIPTAPETFENPIAQSVGSFACLALALAAPLAISLQGSASRQSTSSSKHRIQYLPTVACAILGTSLWFAFAMQDLQNEQANANQELEQLFADFSQKLQQQESAIDRIVTRLSSIDDKEAAATLMQEDLSTYITDYSALVGLMVIDEQQNFVTGNTFAERVFYGEEFSHLAVKDWLANPDLSHNSVTLTPATATDSALIMMRKDLHAAGFQNTSIIALFDVHQLLNTAKFDTSFARFWQVDEQLIIPLEQHQTDTHVSLQEVVANSPAIHRSFNFTSGGELNLFSIFNQNERLRAEAIANQAILFLSFLFIGVIAINHKRDLQLQAEKARLDKTSRFDQVTHLLRRQALGERLKSMSSASFAKSGMLFINLDGFQPINDSLGTALGDELLHRVAQRIANSAPSSALCARYSSDEFIVVFLNVEHEQLERIAKELLRSLRVPYYVGGAEIHLTASVGFALGKNTHNSPTELTSQAEFAMREAKRLGGNLATAFSPCMQQNYSRRAYLRTQLQSAIDNHDLKVYYQPIVDAKTSRIVAVESLVRWQHKEIFISPGEFIPIAERTGQIIPLGEQVLEQVLEDAQQHPALAAIQLSINISIQQLQRYEFPKLLAAKLATYQVAATNIILELTEGVFIDPNDNHNRSLDQLLELQCQLAIDDFGSGFSSLSYLHTIPANIIKLDRSFIGDIATDPQRYNLVKRIIELCRTLDKKIVVEGVETAEQAKLLRTFDIDRMQGFHFYRPMPLTELIETLEKASTA